MKKHPSRLAAQIRRGSALASIGAGLLATSCAVAVTDPAASAAHPASPRAAEAPAPIMSTTLAVGTGLESQHAVEPAVDEPALAPSNHGAHSGHQMPGHTHPAGQSPSKADAAATYTCPMHPEVTSNAPGKCPKCGMKLQAATKKTPKSGAE